jgi:diaminopimelate decarboxylase
MHDFRYIGRDLFCEGVAVEALAEKFGTPLYVYSQHTLTGHFQKLDTAMSPVKHLVCFAIKSNSNLSVLRTLAQLGSGFDIVSGGELQRVVAAGGNPRQCVFAGVGKTGDEIEFALRQNERTGIASHQSHRRAVEKNRTGRGAGESECRGMHARENHDRHLRK